MTINEDSSVQILAEEAHKVEDLDITAARWGRVYVAQEIQNTVKITRNLRLTPQIVLLASLYIFI